MNYWMNHSRRDQGVQVICLKKITIRFCVVINNYQQSIKEIE